MHQAFASFTRRIAVGAAAAALLTACADYTNPQALNSPDVNPDPNEGLNRGLYAVNHVIDEGFLRPVTIGYRYVVPEKGREGVHNFVENIYAPVTFVNSVLQGDQQNSFATFWRFVINTTVGIGGIFDVAKEAGLTNRTADFGQTLASWGVASGPYTFIPVLGPGTLRDSLGRIPDIFFNPVMYMDPSYLVYAQTGTAIVDKRSQAHPALESIRNNSLDPYATLRSGYLQSRSADIAKVREQEPVSYKLDDEETVSTTETQADGTKVVKKVKRHKRKPLPVAGASPANAGGTSGTSDSTSTSPGGLTPAAPSTANPKP